MVVVVVMWELGTARARLVYGEICFFYLFPIGGFLKRTQPWAREGGEVESVLIGIDWLELCLLEGVKNKDKVF